MTGLIIIGIIILLVVVAVQIGRISDLAVQLRGEKAAEQATTNSQATWLVIFMVLFLIITAWSAYHFKNYMLGYGPLTSASEHGVWVDSMFNLTLVFTGIVFVITQILTFWYAFKYRSRKGGKAKFLSHNNTLELVWTLIPAITMAFLVVKGLVAWNKIMPDVDANDNYIEVEATGYQFAWDLRLPGADNKLGTKSISKIDMANNQLGLDFTDEKTHDDVILAGSDKLVLPVDTTVRIRITSKDVLHNFYLPHFRVKMDAVPGLPTYFNFKPTKTTAEFRNELSQYEEWNQLYDETDPDLGPRWKNFNYELACAELCGKGHYSMKRIIEVVSKEDYEAWKKEQKSYYMTNIRGTEADPYRNDLLKSEIAARAAKLTSDIDAAMNADDMSDRIILLEHVFYRTGSAALDNKSRYELDHLVSIMNKHRGLKVELRGHTDNVGDDAMNMNLSDSRAHNVMSYLTGKGISADRLIAKGYGENLPIESNDTEEGRLMNRRTELRLISK